jgi:predicted O-methyltransferase YrrM
MREMLSLAPKFHLDENGDPISWAIGCDVLEYLADTVGKESFTVETGAGLSTVAFALRGCHHTAIAPSSYEFERIREFCARHSISLERTELIEDYSEQFLPGLSRDRRLDLFLVDGRHAFPSPYIDWYYGALMLDVGGLMVIDDTQLLTGAVLRDFMTEDDYWDSVMEFPKTSVFRKMKDGFQRAEWNQQPYIMNRQ